jgi:hypothetical protein
LRSASVRAELRFRTVQGKKVSLEDEGGREGDAPSFSAAMRAASTSW